MAVKGAVARRMSRSSTGITQNSARTVAVRPRVCTVEALSGDGNSARFSSWPFSRTVVPESRNDEQSGSGRHHTGLQLMNSAASAIGHLGAALTFIDDGVVKSAAMGEHCEIRSARIAHERSLAQPVRATALQMIADHLTSTHHLQAALEMNDTGDVALPQALLDEHGPPMLQRLEKSSQYAGDKIYLNQAMAREESVVLIHGYIRTGTNPALRSVALPGNPVCGRHLEHVKTSHAAP